MNGKMNLEGAIFISLEMMPRLEILYMRRTGKYGVENKVLMNDTSILRRNLDGGKYLVLRIPHTQEAVEKAWNENIPNLIQKGYRLDYSRPIMERYRKKMVDNQMNSIYILEVLIEICFGKFNGYRKKRLGMQTMDCLFQYKRNSIFVKFMGVKS